MEVTLERLKENGVYANEALYLNQLKSYSFGQMSSNDFILYAPTVEYNHCIFHNKPDGLFVEVLKSSWGVFIINGKKCLSNSIVRLNNNDVVNIGLLLKYRVKMKAAFPIADNYNYDYVKIENDTEDSLPYYNVNDSTVENVGNKAMPSAETYQLENPRKVKKYPSKVNESGHSLQVIDAAMQIEIGKQENELETSLSFDSSASVNTESHHLSSESKSHEFATMSASDFSFEHQHLSDSLLRNEYLPNSSHEYDRPFMPNKCDQAFLSQQRLQTHSVYHGTEKVFGCEICGKIFKKKTIIRHHIVTVHSQEKQTCKICMKVFACKAYLQQHMLSHSTEKRFKCSLCAKSLRHKQDLQKHLLTHSTEKQFKCPLCEKAFRHKQYLRRHMIIHSTEKKFKCSLCDKSCRRKQEMQKHMLSHSTKNSLSFPNLSIALSHQVTGPIMQESYIPKNDFSSANFDRKS